MITPIYTGKDSRGVADSAFIARFQLDKPLAHANLGRLGQPRSLVGKKCVVIRIPNPQDHYFTLCSWFCRALNMFATPRSLLPCIMSAGSLN